MTSLCVCFSGLHRATEGAPVGRVCSPSTVRRSEENTAATHTCWQRRVVNIPAEVAFALREEGRAAQTSESPEAASFLSSTRGRFLLGTRWAVFPICESPFPHLVPDTAAHVPTFHPAVGLPPTLDKVAQQPVRGEVGHRVRLQTARQVFTGQRRK